MDGFLPPTLPSSQDTNQQKMNFTIVQILAIGNHSEKSAISNAAQQYSAIRTQ